MLCNNISLRRLARRNHKDSGADYFLLDHQGLVSLQLALTVTLQFLWFVFGCCIDRELAMEHNGLHGAPRLSYGAFVKVLFRAVNRREVAP